MFFDLTTSKFQEMFLAILNKLCRRRIEIKIMTKKKLTVHIFFKFLPTECSKYCEDEKKIKSMLK